MVNRRMAQSILLSICLLACTLSGCNYACDESALSGTWEKEFSSIRGSEIFPASGGGYYIAGSVPGPGGRLDPAAFLMKLDNMGEEEWSTTFPDDDFSLASGVVEAPDSSVIVAGTGSHGTHAAKVDSEGEIRWNRVFETGESFRLPLLTTTSDGDFGLATYKPNGFFEPFGETHVLKFDSDGDVVWYRRLDDSDDVVPEGIIPGADGGLILLTSEFLLEDYLQDEKLTYAGTHSIQVAQLAGDDGATTWKLIDIENYRGVSSIAAADEGGFVLSTHELLRHYDAAGTMISEYDVLTEQDYFEFSSSETPDGGYLLGGYTFQTGRFLMNDCGNILLAKLNEDGTVEWEREYGGNSLEYLNDIATTPDGGYVVLATRGWKFGRLLGNTLVMRIDGD